MSWQLVFTEQYIRRATQLAAGGCLIFCVRGAE